MPLDERGYLWQGTSFVHLVKERAGKPALLLNITCCSGAVWRPTPSSLSSFRNGPTGPPDHCTPKAWGSVYWRVAVSQ